MGVSYYGLEEDAPKILIDTMRNLAIDHYQSWLEDESNLVTFAREYLNTCEYKEYLGWDQGYHTALYLMKINDICNEIIYIAEHGQQT